MKARIVGYKLDVPNSLNTILNTAAESVGLRIDDVTRLSCNTLQFRLRLDRDIQPMYYQKLSKNWTNHVRKVNAVCWHGFRDFFIACYKLQDNIRFDCGTGMMAGVDVPMRIVYEDSRDFYVKYPETNSETVSNGVGCFVSELCDCNE